MDQPAEPVHVAHGQRILEPQNPPVFLQQLGCRSLAALLQCEESRIAASCGRQDESQRGDEEKYRDGRYQTDHEIACQIGLPDQPASLAPHIGFSGSLALIDAPRQAPAKGNPRLGTRRGPQKVSALTKSPLPTDRQGAIHSVRTCPSLSEVPTSQQRQSSWLIGSRRYHGRITVAGQRRLLTGFALSPSRGDLCL